LPNAGQGPKLVANRVIGVVVGSVVVSGLIIMGFYLVAD